MGPPGTASGELPPRPHPQAVAVDTGFPLDTEGAVETPIPTPEELRILRQVVDPERVFPKCGSRPRVEDTADSVCGQ